MTDVYVACPTCENELVALRPLRADDAEALLSCYSDALAVPFFNGDNCDGDDFHYATLPRMRQAVVFWRHAYAERWFVRWVIVDQATGRAIGTVEMFHNDPTDRPLPYGVLRVDVQSPFETRAYLRAILSLCADRFFELFDVRELVTKAWPDAVERRAALESLGFEPTAFRTYNHYMRLTGRPEARQKQE